MSFWKRLFGGTSYDDTTTYTPPPVPVINPATGLPMPGDGYGGFDVGGSPFGSDVHQEPYSPPPPFSGTDPW